MFPEPVSLKILPPEPNLLYIKYVLPALLALGIGSQLEVRVIKPSESTETLGYGGRSIPAIKPISESIAHPIANLVNDCQFSTRELDLAKSALRDVRVMGIFWRRENKWLGWDITGKSLTVPEELLPAMFRDFRPPAGPFALVVSRKSTIKDSWTTTLAAHFGYDRIENATEHVTCAPVQIRDSTHCPIQFSVWIPIEQREKLAVVKGANIQLRGGTFTFVSVTDKTATMAGEGRTPGRSYLFRTTGYVNRHRTFVDQLIHAADSHSEMYFPETLDRKQATQSMGVLQPNETVTITEYSFILGYVGGINIKPLAQLNP